MRTHTLWHSSHVRGFRRAYGQPQFSEVRCCTWVGVGADRLGDRARAPGGGGKSSTKCEEKGTRAYIFLKILNFLGKDDRGDKPPKSFSMQMRRGLFGKTVMSVTNDLIRLFEFALNSEPTAGYTAAVFGQSAAFKIAGKPLDEYCRRAVGFAPSFILLAKLRGRREAVSLKGMRGSQEIFPPLCQGVLPDTVGSGSRFYGTRRG